MSGLTRIGSKNARLAESDRVLSGTVEDRTKDTFLERVDENIDEKAEMLRDIAFYYEKEAVYEPSRAGYDKKKKNKPFRYDVIEDLVDSKQRNKGYREILNAFDDLDLSKYDYKVLAGFLRR